MNRALIVARHDFENARRSYMLWGVVGIFLALILALTALPGLLSEDASGRFVVGIITAPAKLFVPITAVVASYLAIAGERESGQLNVLLSLPPSRLQVVAGKLLGRSAVVLGAVLVAFLVATVVSVPLYDGFPVVSFLLTMGLTGLLGLAFVGIAVGISALTSTRTRAMAPAVGVVILFATGIWGGLLTAINLVAEWGLDVSLDAETLTLIQLLSPSAAYQRLFESIVRPRLVEGSIEAATRAGFIPDTTGAPFYLQDWFVFLLLAAWVVVPVAVGYLRFERADLT